MSTLFQTTLLSILLGLIASCRTRPESLLPADKAVGGVLSGSQQLTFPVKLERNQLASIRVDQQGIDLEFTLRDPAGVELYRVDRWSAPSGPETISFAVQRSGSYTVLVKAVAQDAPSGNFTITLSTTESFTKATLNSVEAALRALKPYNRGRALRQEGKRESSCMAIDEFQLAFDDLGDLGDPLWRASALTNLAESTDDCRGLHGNPAYYEKALVLWKEAREPDGQAEVLHNMGVAQYEAGNVKEAMIRYEQALPVWRLAKDIRGEADTLSVIGRAHETLGDYEEALKYQFDALVLFRQVKDSSWESYSLHSLGMVHVELGNLDTALAEYQESLAISKRLKDSFGEAHLLHHIGELYALDQKYDLAERILSESLVASERLGDLLGQATTLVHLGNVRLAMSDPKGALPLFEKALKLREEQGYGLGMAQCHHAIGEAFYKLKRSHEAITEFNLQFEIARRIPEPRSEAEALDGLARAQRQLNNLRTALTLARAAVSKVEAIRHRLWNPEFRAAYFTSAQDEYSTLIDVLMLLAHKQHSRDFQAQAFEMNERSHARSFLELIAGSRVQVGRNIEPELLNEKRALEDRLAVKSEQYFANLTHSGFGDRQRQFSDIQELNGKLNLLMGRIRREDPASSSLTQMSSHSLSEIQQGLDSDSIVFEYSLGAERSYLWVVANKSFRSFNIPKSSDIEHLCHQLIDELSNGTGWTPIGTADAVTGKANLGLAPSRAAVQLTRVLLSPALVDVQHYRRLIFAPDGILEYLPFSALPLQTSSEPLIVSHESLIVPSTSVLIELRQRTDVKNTKDLAVFADPVFSLNDSRVSKRDLLAAGRTRSNPDSLNGVDGSTALPRLVWSQREAELIMRHMSPDKCLVATGFDSSLKTIARLDLQQFRFIHFATHGVIDTGRPALSGLFLSRFDDKGNAVKGLLGLRQIYNLKLASQCVILSACRTALGQQIRGEGLVGMVRGFLFAGSRSVVASLWNVDDAQTAELMDQFYGAIAERGAQPAEALRAAQEALWREGKSARLWAAFVPYGNWN